MINKLKDIIDRKRITTKFMPIISLRDGGVLGYEALSRGPVGNFLEMPDQIFEYAKKYDLTYELEYLCREKAIETAGKLSLSKLLFINIDPKIINSIHFKNGFTKEFLKNNNLSPDLVIFEITEKTAIDDYKSMEEATEYYKNQGYKIALDDYGAGYSGLKTLHTIKPNYVKIDMELIRDIHKDNFKIALIESVVSFCNSSNIKIIAEGIETKEELMTLIKLGVHYGQGFYIGKPVDYFSSVEEETKNFIFNYNFKEMHMNYKYKYILGEIATEEKAFSPLDIVCDVGNYINSSDNRGVAIVENDYPIGLIMKESIDSKMAVMYGYSVFSKREVNLIMDRNPLIVDYYTPLDKTTNFAMNREISKIYDCVIVTKDSKYFGLVTIKSLLLHTTELEKDKAKDLNPLTGLPGNVLIERYLDNIIENDVLCNIIYVDLDNFKAFNDKYGFEKGDQIINLTANLISSSLIKSTCDNYFLGHIGGDDFLCVLNGNLNEGIDFSESLLIEFENNIKVFFSEEEVKSGFFQSTDRKEDIKVFSLTSLSIALLFGRFNGHGDRNAISRELAKLKKKAKGIQGNSLVIKTIE